MATDRNKSLKREQLAVKLGTGPTGWSFQSGVWSTKLERMLKKYELDVSDLSGHALQLGMEPNWPTLPTATPVKADNDHSPDTRTAEPTSVQGSDNGIDALKSPLSQNHFFSVPGYVILGVLGQGGMGVVYKAHHISLSRTVALKVVQRSLCSQEDDRQRFRREAEAIARLNHPNVVQVFEVGESEGNTYLAMEYAECGTLHSWQNHQAIPPRLSAEIVKTLAAAMQHAHERGIIHRDLKPANILLNAERETAATVFRPGLDPSNQFPFVPKITDFGLAKLADNSVSLTAPGVACGTPAYMSPEQIHNAGDPIGPNVDVYALGAILYELLTGLPVFQASSAHAIFELALAKPPVRPRVLRPDVSADLEAICLKCLEKSRHARYATAGELADDLQRFLNGLPILARHVGRAERVWRWCRRNPWPAAALAITSLTLCVTTVLSVALWQAEGRAVAAREAEARQADELEVALDELQAQHNALIGSRDREAAEFHRAEENLRIARDAARATLLELVREPLLQEPKFLEVQRRLLDQAKPMFDQFVAQSTDNLAILTEQADLCRMLADLRATIGDTAHAGQRYREALTLYTRLMKLQPGDITPTLARADVQLQYAFLLRETGGVAEGDRLVDECIAELMRVASQFKNSDEFAVVFVRARLSYLHRSSTPERARTAEAYTQAAAEAVTDMIHRLGSTDRTRYLQARVLQQSARIDAAAGLLAEAVCHFAEAAAVLDSLVANGPRDLNRRGELIGLQLEHAALLMSKGRTMDARDQVQTAVGRLDAILAESPRGVRFLILWARATVALGMIEEEGGNPTAALDCYNRVAERWLPVLNKYPEWTSGRQAARDMLSRRASLYEQQGNRDAAAADRARHDRITPP